MRRAVRLERRERAAGRRRAGRPVRVHRPAVAPSSGQPTRTIAAYDLGMKWNILRRFTNHGLDVQRVPGDDAGRGGAGDQAGGDLLQQRPRRSGRARLRRPQRQGRRRIRRAGLRHLPRPPGARDGHRRLDLQAEVRPPRHQPSGQAPRDRQGRDHVAEPRLRRRPDVAAEGRRGHAPEPLRQHGRRPAAPRAAGLLRAVPPRGGARSARRRLSVRDSSSTRSTGRNA